MKSMLRFLRPYKKRIVPMLLPLSVQAIGIPYIPTFTANVVNNGIVAGGLNFVWKTGGFILLITMITALVSILSTYTPTYISTSVGRDIRGALFREIQDFSVSDSQQFGAASLIAHSTSDAAQVQQAFSAVVEMFLLVPFMTVAGLVLAPSKNRLLALIIMGSMLLIVLFTLALGKKPTPIYEKLQSMPDNINRTVRQSIIGVRTIRASNRGRYEKMKMDEMFREYADTTIKASKLYAVMIPLVMTLMNFCTFITVWVDDQQAAAGQMQIGDIMAMIEYATFTLMYLLMGAYVSPCILWARTCICRINQVLSTNSEFAGRAVPLHVLSTGAKAELQNMTFRYAGAEEPILHDVSLTARKGQTAAITGSTGSGKSTIVSLLLRLYGVQQDHVLTDGKDVREYPQEKLRDKIGYVSQRAFLFSGTVMDNLRHDEKDATNGEMHRAADIAQTDDSIVQTEGGLLTLVSQGDNNSSGEQKQRSSIVRATIRKPDIYTLDDSSSTLDFKTDARLRQVLKQGMMDSTVVIVAQRISTIVDTDQTIVLDEGRIVGKGTHQELLHSRLIYQQIVQSQLSREELV